MTIPEMMRKIHCNLKIRNQVSYKIGEDIGENGVVEVLISLREGLFRFCYFVPPQEEPLAVVADCMINALNNGIWWKEDIEDLVT